jgi:vacuolar protein sorting-associated protein 35
MSFSCSFSTGLQWLITWWLFRDDYWNLRKNDVRGIYDGTAFYRLADRNGHPWYGMSARRDAVAEKNMG